MASDGLCILELYRANAYSQSMSFLGVRYLMLFNSSPKSITAKIASLWKPFPALALWSLASSIGVLGNFNAIAQENAASRKDSSEQAKPVVTRNSGDTAVVMPDLNASDWTVLFNGKDLTGWIQKNGWANYRIIDDTIQGTTNTKSPNSFLCTAESYGDFEFAVEVKCDPQLNSGIQTRSASDPAVKNGHVFGPQIEIATNLSGYIYGEATGRGWLSPTHEPHDKFKNDQWNQYIIRASGKRLQTWINGHLIEDINDPIGAESGFIGLQVHSIKPTDGPYKVQWRNIRIRKL
jgi:hypothetical protein